MPNIATQCVESWWRFTAWVLGCALLFHFSGCNKPSRVSNNAPIVDPPWVHQLPLSMSQDENVSFDSFFDSPTYVRRYWHDRFSGHIVAFKNQFNWKAEEFFEDPQVVALCKAITAKDLAKMESLIAKGVDVNARGLYDVTPLYWAFHIDTDPRPFGLLLQHGADPNVVAKMRGSKWSIGVPGDRAVVHLVVEGVYNRHFKTVFEHGGDPNLTTDTDPPWAPFNLSNTQAPDALERFQVLVAAGADLDRRESNGKTFVAMRSRGHGAMGFALVLAALNAGASYDLEYDEDGRKYRLIHYLAEEEAEIAAGDDEKRERFHEVVDWLQAHGESFESAREDVRRWREVKFQRRIMREIMKGNHFPRG